MEEQDQPAPKIGVEEPVEEPARESVQEPEPVQASVQEPVLGELQPIWPDPFTGAATKAWRRWGVFARSAATVGGLLFFVAAWAPWAAALTSGDLRLGSSGPAYRFMVTPGQLGAPPLSALAGPDGAFFVWSVLTILGALLSPLFWQRSVPWLIWAASTLYGLWLALCGVTLVGVSWLLFHTIPSLTHAATGPYTTTLLPYGVRLAIYSTSAAPGLFVAALALLIGALGGVFAVLAQNARRAATKPVAPTIHGEVAIAESPAKRSLPGVGAVTGGLLLWAWGFFLLPWATLNCVDAPLLIGQCQGLPVASALQAGLTEVRNVIDPAAAPFAISGLLLGGAFMALVAVWRRDITRTLCAWLSVWLAFALGCALLAISGAQRVVHDAPSVGLPEGNWRGDTGVLIVFLALLLVGIGLAPLWAVAVRAAQRRAAVGAI